MKCRENCGACCIAPSIKSVIPGMSTGKPAGVKCIHLLDDMRCAIFKSIDRPKVCAGFMPEEIICGETREEALRNIEMLEKGEL